MPDSGPCGQWVTHDLSTFVDETALFGSGSSAAFTSGNLAATSLRSGLWGVTIPSIYLPVDGPQFVIEISYVNPFDAAAGTDTLQVFSLASPVPATEGSVADDFHNLYATPHSLDGATVVTVTLPAADDPSTGLTFGANYTADVVGKGYRYAWFQFAGFSTEVTQIRTMNLCANTVTPPLRLWPRSDGYGLSSAPRLYPRPPSIQSSNRRAGGYL